MLTATWLANVTIYYMVAITSRTVSTFLFSSAMDTCLRTFAAFAMRFSLSVQTPDFAHHTNTNTNSITSRYQSFKWFSSVVLVYVPALVVYLCSSFCTRVRSVITRSSNVATLAFSAWRSVWVVRRSPSSWVRVAWSCWSISFIPCTQTPIKFV